MKKHEKKDISQFQWITIILGMTIGIGTTTLPRGIATEAGRDGWFSILLSTLIVIIYANICLYFSRLFPDKTLAQSSIIILGKFWGTILIVIYSLYALTLSGLVLRFFMNIAYVYLDIQYPMVFHFIIILSVIIYIARNGLSTLSRLSELVLFYTLPLFILFLIPVSLDKHINLLPVFEGGIVEPVKAIQEPLLAFLGIEIILVFYPYLNKKEDDAKLTNIAIIITGLIYTSIFIVSLMMMGLEQLNLTYWPFIEYLKIIDIAVIERIDTLFIHLWLGKVILVSSIQYFVATFSLAHITNKDYHDIWSLVAWPIVLFVALVPQNVPETEEFAANFTLYGGGLVILIPILLIITCKLRGVR
ncbi:endospore germination permease [Natranaerobius thermophilus]|uniref:GerAB/ArcD/ProY family transporter n=1 Tax=Natranaerobius thermophilus TaxID=375929 RepID=UPI002F3FBC3D